MIETKQEKYELIITSHNATSNDDRFKMENLGLGNNYKTLDAYFKNSQGEVIHRVHGKNEQKISNQTLPRLAFQIFEKQIKALSDEEKKNFPVCQYTLNSEIIRGIFANLEDYNNYRKTYEYSIYNYDGDKQFVIYCWNVFSTIIFVQECLKRFGNEGDTFFLEYCEKEKDSVSQGNDSDFNGYINPYSDKLIESKNIIFRGAPGTGKTYLAKEIAADIVSEGNCSDYGKLTEEQKRQIEFVQFHPSYDYTDFVEGLRPKANSDGSIGFELQDGIFKRFADRARRNCEDSKKSQEVMEREASVQEIMAEYFTNIELGAEELETARGTKFYITSIDDKHIKISIPENKVSDKINLNIAELKEMLESSQKFNQVKDVTKFFEKLNATQQYSYFLAMYNEILSRKSRTPKPAVKDNRLKNYVFIIDEINRGEISKIFGELFFSIDPGYRGQAGEVSTQYANLHDKPNEKFYVPENVYIIATMNDIDRSVDSFDFAMRRRFRFIEIRADERLEMLDILGDKKEDAIGRMTALNKEISKVAELNENYHIGASYFMKLNTLSPELLWTDYIFPLLQDYIRGMYNEESIMQEFASAYGYIDSKQGDDDESSNN